MFYAPLNMTELTIRKHAILAVGYKFIENQLYYKLKNSWGGKWGNEGFVLVPAEIAKEYGLFKEAYFPIMSGQVSLNLL